MKLATALLKRFTGTRADAPDAFELRLKSMGAENKRRTGRTDKPNLFVRSARQAA